MPVILPTKERVKQINIYVIQNSTDPDEDRSLAGNFNNESSLDFALNPPCPYETAFEAAYGIAKAIANDHVFSNGNKRTAKRTVIETCNGNNLNFNGNEEALLKLVNSLVKEDGDDDKEVEETFIRGISKLFSK